MRIDPSRQVTRRSRGPTASERRSFLHRFGPVDCTMIRGSTRSTRRPTSRFQLPWWGISITRAARVGSRCSSRAIASVWMSPQRRSSAAGRSPRSHRDHDRLVVHGATVDGWMKHSPEKGPVRNSSPRPSEAISTLPGPPNGQRRQSSVSPRSDRRIAHRDAGDRTLQDFGQSVVVVGWHRDHHRIEVADSSLLQLRRSPEAHRSDRGTPDVVERGGGPVSNHDGGSSPTETHASSDHQERSRNTEDPRTTPTIIKVARRTRALHPRPIGPSPNEAHGLSPAGRREGDRIHQPAATVDQIDPERTDRHPTRHVREALDRTRPATMPSSARSNQPRDHGHRQKRHQDGGGTDRSEGCPNRTTMTGIVTIQAVIAVATRSMSEERTASRSQSILRAEPAIPAAARRTDQSDGGHRGQRNPAIEPSWITHTMPARTSMSTDRPRGRRPSSRQSGHHG